MGRQGSLIARVGYKNSIFSLFSSAPVGGGAVKKVNIQYYRQSTLTLVQGSIWTSPPPPTTTSCSNVANKFQRISARLRGSSGFLATLFLSTRKHFRKPTALIDDSNQRDNFRNNNSTIIRYKGLDEWLRCRAPVLKVHCLNPAMIWLKITAPC